MKNHFFGLMLMMSVPAIAAVSRVDRTPSAQSLTLADIKEARGVCVQAMPRGQGRPSRAALPSNEVLHLCEYVEFLAQAHEVGVAPMSYEAWTGLNSDFTTDMPRALFLKRWDYRRVLSLGLKLSEISLPRE